MKIQCGKSEYPIEEVIDRYNEMLFRLAMARMQQKEDAEEVVQDTFLRLITQVKKGKTFEDEEHLKAWLLTVAVNRGKSILTLAWNRRTQGMSEVHEMAAPENEEGYAYAFVSRLPEKYRVAIDLFYYEELTTEQIAAIMKTKPATVRSYLHRGRERLKEMMEAENYVG
ncbi:MAG: RNA polymerase sigma factor [Lachnospiraceae bacterium]